MYIDQEPLDFVNPLQFGRGFQFRIQESMYVVVGLSANKRGKHGTRS